MARPCKICKLEKKNKTAFKELTEEILNGEKGNMAPFLRGFNKKHKLNIIPMNVQRHKTHMGGNVAEIKEQQESNYNETVQNRTLQASKPNALIFEGVSKDHMDFLLKYREYGYTDKEKAWIDSGHSGQKYAHDLLKRPEIKAALYEMKATDYVNMRYTGNQVLSDLMKVAHFPEYWAEACDENGHIKNNIHEWPKELREVLAGIEITEDVLKASDDDEGVILRRKFKYKFPDPLKARTELRKHGVEVEMYQKSLDKAEFYEELMSKMIAGTISPVMALFEMAKDSLPMKDMTKLLMAKVEPGDLANKKIIDFDSDIDMSALSDDELDHIIMIESSKK